jgi:hypothetical protein
VLDDALDGLITAEEVRRNYGVVIDAQRPRRRMRGAHPVMLISFVSGFILVMFWPMPS